MRYDALHIVLPQCRFLYRVSKAICKQLPPLQFLCANIASCVEKHNKIRATDVSRLFIFCYCVLEVPTTMSTQVR
jgi:hypothetical protein